MHSKSSFGELFWWHIPFKFWHVPSKSFPAPFGLFHSFLSIPYVSVNIICFPCKSFPVISVSFTFSISNGFSFHDSFQFLSFSPSNPFPLLSDSFILSCRFLLCSFVFFSFLPNPFQFLSDSFYFALMSFLVLLIQAF